jgi:hypothetical protein
MLLTSGFRRFRGMPSRSCNGDAMVPRPLPWLPRCYTARPPVLPLYWLRAVSSSFMPCGSFTSILTVRTGG